MEATHSERSPWRITILFSNNYYYIIIAIILITVTLISIIIIITIIIVIITIIYYYYYYYYYYLLLEWINYSVIHTMAVMSTLTGLGIPTLTGPGALC